MALVNHLELLLDDVLVLQREAIVRKGLECQLYLHPDVPAWLMTDPTRLKQVLNNLFSNAVIDSGEVSIRVKRLREGQLSFCIRDEGIGMDASTCAKLFSRFEQADSSISRRYGGTGLGLAISNHLVTLFNGAIEVHSQPGEGSTFTFDIQHQQCSHPENRPDINRLAMATTDERWIEAMSLLAERWQLGFLAIDPTQPDSGVELRKLTLADACEMPEMDGYTATQKIRSAEQSESRPRVPIIALTAHVLPEFREKAHLSGMSEYITKPINREELLQTILRLTASGQSRLHG
jgi:CheY-like chemotaxis protein